jgi:hypothetical protein
LAAPAKFGTPSLTRPVALDVGRHTFKTQLRVEMVVATLLVMIVLVAASSSLTLAIPIGVGFVVAIQYVYLYPALYARAETIINGATPPAAAHHETYIALEAIKVVALLILAVFLLQSA